MSESPLHPFHGSVRKTDRAVTHLHSLQGEIKTFLDEEPAPLRAISKVDVESSRYLMRVAIDRQFPDSWELLVGDFVQNLRAALDHLVCQFIYAKGQEPTTSHAFPIVDSPPKKGTRGWQRWNSALAGLNRDAIEFIERTQPYNGPDGPTAHTFHALRELSNEDKHRLLLPAVAAITTPGEAFEIEVVRSRDIGPIKGGRLYTGYALKHGDLVVEAPVEIIGPNPEIKANANFTFDIGFGRKPIVPTKGLTQMFKSVRMTVHLAARELMGYSDEVLEAELQGWLAPE